MGSLVKYLIRFFVVKIGNVSLELGLIQGWHKGSPQRRAKDYSQRDTKGNSREVFNNPTLYIPDPHPDFLRLSN